MANCGRGCGADAGGAVGILCGGAADERGLLSESGWARAAAAGGGVRLERVPGEVEKLLRMLPKGDEVFEDFLKGKNAGFEVSELCGFTETKDSAPRVLAGSLLQKFEKPKASPVHPVVAFLKSEGESLSLEVLPLEGGPGFSAAIQVTASFDWSPDGRTLVFMAPFGKKGDTLQCIRRLAVLQESGALMKPQHEKQSDGSTTQVEGPDRLKSSDILATAKMSSLQVLADGRILFASHPASFPTLGAGAPPDTRFYLISADGKSLQSIPTPPDSLVELSRFVASPDGKQIAVVVNNAVTVVQVATGKTQAISPSHPRWKSCTLPAWQSATALSFVALQNGAPKWLLWSADKGIRCLSERWPAESTADWLHEKKDSTDPAPAG